MVLERVRGHGAHPLDHHAHELAVAAHVLREPDQLFCFVQTESAW